MDFKCFRIFNAFNKDLSTLYILILVAVLVAGVVSNVENPNLVAIIDTVVISFWVLLFFFLILPLGYPKKVSLFHNKLIYKKRIFESKGTERQKSEKITVTVYNIRNFTYYQNLIEKKFNVGRIKFMGNTNVDSVKFVNYKVGMVHELYGIRDFKNFIKCVELSDIKCTESKF